MRRQSATRQAGGGNWRVWVAAGAWDAAIAALAAKQRGVVARWQLLKMGMDSNAIQRRLRSGRLHQVHRGVYFVGHEAAVEGAYEMAGALACGPHALTSHDSSAAVWRLIPYPANSTTVHVTAIGGSHRCRPGIRAHRVASIDQRETRRVGGIPATSAARTLLDLAGSWRPARLEPLVADALARHLTTRTELESTLAANRRRPGAGAFAALLSIGPQLTESDAEARFLSLVRQARRGAPGGRFCGPPSHLASDRPRADGGRRQSHQGARPGPAALAAPQVDPHRLVAGGLVQT